MDHKCFQCKKEKITNVMQVLSCKHLICEYCYLRILITSKFDPIHTVSIVDDEAILKYKCKCQNGEGTLNLLDYNSTIQIFIDSKLKYRCKIHPSLIAEVYCNKCSLSLCSNCYLDSACVKHTEPHSLLTKCKIHNYNDLNIYCDDCKHSLCRVCKVLNHADHHTTVYDSSKREKTINEFQYKTFNDINGKLNQLHSKAVNGYRTVMKDKMKAFDDLIKKIEAIKEEARVTIEKKKNQIASIIQMLKLIYQNMFLDSEIDLNQFASMKKLLNCFLYSIQITPEADNELIQIANKVKAYTASSFKYEFIFKKSKLNCCNVIKYDNQKITTMASLGKDKVGIAIESSLRLYDFSLNAFYDNNYQHDGYINAILPLSETIIATGSNDKSIRLWDTQSTAEVHCFLGHLKEVTALCFIQQGLFASASRDSTVKVWNYLALQEEYSLVDKDNDAINSVICFSNKIIASAGESEKIKVWSDQKEPFTLYGHVNTITKLLRLKDNRMASASLDCTVKIWKKNVCQITLEGHSDGVLIIYQLKDNRLISGSMDQTVRIWDLQANTCEQELKAHQDYIIAIVEIIYQGTRQGNENVVLTASYDNCLKIWK